MMLVRCAPRRRAVQMRSLRQVRRLSGDRDAPTPQAVVDEHLDAINKCDWKRLMAQYPPNVEFFLPGARS